MENTKQDNIRFIFDVMLELAKNLPKEERTESSFEGKTKDELINELLDKWSAWGILEQIEAAAEQMSQPSNNKGEQI